MRQGRALREDAVGPAASGKWLGIALTSLVVPAALLVAYAFEWRLGRLGRLDLFEAFGLNPLLIRQGRWELLISYVVLHGSVVAVLVNAGIVSVGGIPLIRALGGAVRGLVGFLIYFEAIGILAGLAFCLLHWRDDVTIVGASAAASGILGAAARLSWGREKPHLLGFFSPQVLIVTVLFAVYHVISLLMAGRSSNSMAWESHLAGYALGLGLISPWLHLFHRQYFTTN